MSKLKTSIPFDVSRERFIQFSNEPGLLEHIAADSELSTREAFGRVETDDTVSWRVRLALDENIPKTVRKLLGNKQLSWTNEFVLNKKTHEMRFTTVESSLDRFFDFYGDVKLAAHGPWATSMEMDGELSTKVPLIGKSLGSFMGDKIIEGWKRDAASRARYFAKRMNELAAAGELSEEELQAFRAANPN